MIAALTTAKERNDDSEGGNTLATLQQRDAELAPMIKYLETGTLPPDDKEARQIAISSGQYTLEDNILYHVEDDGTLPSPNQRECLFTKAHEGSLERISAMQRCTVRSGDITGGWGCVEISLAGQKGCIICATRSMGSHH